MCFVLVDSRPPVSVPWGEGDGVSVFWSVDAAEEVAAALGWLPGAYAVVPASNLAPRLAVRAYLAAVVDILRGGALSPLRR